MARESPPTGSFAQQIGLLFEGSSVAGMSDQALLNRFTARQDRAGEEAFAALVTRHGPMVLGVCNEVLGDRDFAEDAFQAVFLILARRATAIREPDLLANWLFGVALRTARCARIRRGRRRTNEDTGSLLKARSIVAAPSAEQSLVAREESELLHDEIERLPRAFRLPVVLCYLEGLTVHEACAGSVVHTAQCAAGWRRRAKGCGAGSCAGAWACRPLRWPRACQIALPRPRSRRNCAKLPLARRCGSRRASSMGCPRRHLRGRCCDP